MGTMCVHTHTDMCTHSHTNSIRTSERKGREREGGGSRRVGGKGRRRRRRKSIQRTPASVERDSHPSHIYLICFATTEGKNLKRAIFTRRGKVSFVHKPSKPSCHLCYPSRCASLQLNCTGTNPGLLFSKQLEINVKPGDGESWQSAFVHIPLLWGRLSSLALIWWQTAVCASCDQEDPSSTFSLTSAGLA